MNSTSVLVDDRDPNVKFNGNWVQGGTPNEYLGTVSSSTSLGDSLVVLFHGTSIVAYGTIDSSSGGVTTNYSIDGQYTEQVISQSSIGGGDAYHQQFWASPSLNVSQHRLTVTMVKVNPDPQFNEGTIWFDYFVVSDPSRNGGGQEGGNTGGNGGGNAGGSESGNAGGSEGGNAGGSEGGKGNGNTGGSTGGQQAVTPKKLSKGRIAGCIVGGLIFLTCVVLLGILWLRRRRGRNKAEAQLGYREYHHQGYIEEVHESNGQLLRTHAQQPTEPRSTIQPSIFHVPTLNPATAPPSRSPWLEGPITLFSTRDPAPLNGHQTSEPPQGQFPPLQAGPCSFMEHRENVAVLPDIEVQPPLLTSKDGISGWNSNTAMSSAITQLTQQGRDTFQPRDHFVISPLRTSSSSTPEAILRGKNAIQSSATSMTTAVEGSQVLGGSHKGSKKDDKISSSQFDTSINSERAVHGQRMLAVRHIDSEVRLRSEEVGLQVDLPPVYSPT